VLVMLRGVVDPPADFRRPQLHPVVLEQRRHQRVLGAVERPLVLPDNDRVPAPIRVRQGGDQGGGLRAPPPRHRPALPDIEELRRDAPVPPDQGLGLLPLPDPRRLRVLPVLRRHPPIEPEPQTAPRRPPGPATPRALRPQHQRAAPGLRARHRSVLPPPGCRHPRLPPDGKTAIPSIPDSGWQIQINGRN
jgi:hypothetical protein